MVDLRTLLARAADLDEELRGVAGRDDESDARIDALGRELDSVISAICDAGPSADPPLAAAIARWAALLPTWSCSDDLVSDHDRDRAFEDALDAAGDPRGVTFRAAREPGRRDREREARARHPERVRETVEMLVRFLRAIEAGRDDLLAALPALRRSLVSDATGPWTAAEARPLLERAADAIDRLHAAVGTDDAIDHWAHLRSRAAALENWSRRSLDVH